MLYISQQTAQATINSDFAHRQVFTMLNALKRRSFDIHVNLLSRNLPCSSLGSFETLASMIDHTTQHKTHGG